MYTKENAVLFHERLAALLKERRWTQKELARRSGLTGASISRYLSKKRVPHAQAIKQIADALGVSPNELLGSERDSEGFFRAYSITQKTIKDWTDHQKQVMADLLSGNLS